MNIFYLSAIALMPLTVSAQGINFETNDYQRIGVYDTWQESPFRTGRLEGRAMVVDNPDQRPDDAMGQVPNASARVLAVQRSRYGSNTFGVRIDLNQCFELTPATQYVHVMIHKPRAGCVMLVGLGKRSERMAQSRETEQFWVQSTTTVSPGMWCDAVFPIKGAGGIDIYSLVVVPDLESPHLMDEDFMAYVDDIVINDVPESRLQRDDYPIGFSKNQVYTHAERHLDSVRLSSASDGQQTIVVPSATTVYNDLTDQQLRAKAGDTVSVCFGYRGAWMHGYVYLDRGNDGKLAHGVDSNGKPLPDSDLMAYSYAQGRNSRGVAVTDKGPDMLTPPTFVIPSDLVAGCYRMRFKVDWDALDARGRTDTANGIIQNGGGIIDVVLNVHNDMVSVSDNQLNGEVVADDGSKLDNYRTAFGQPFVIRMKPEKGFTYEGITIRHGYRLAGSAMVHGNRQWRETFIPAKAFKNDRLSIPAQLVDGDLLISAKFVEIK